MKLTILYALSGKVPKKSIKALMEKDNKFNAIILFCITI